MDYFASMDEANAIDQQAVRSAVVLAKLRYDEQLAPFVKSSKERLESSVVRKEIDRIIIECANETNADPDKVRITFQKILADVATTQPEKETLPTGKGFPSETYGEGAPSGKNEKDNAPGNENVETTDVLDHGAVLEDKILDADETIDITKPLNKDSCIRCKMAWAMKDSPVCSICNNALISLSKKKEALGNPPPVPQQPQSQTPPAQPSGTHPLTPLNPNAPYQCTVCGYTGHWDDVNNHLQNAQDPAHVQAKQNQQAQQPQVPQQMAQPPVSFPNTPPANVPSQTASTKEAGEYEEQQQEQDNTAVEKEQAETPSSHFDDVIQNMANRAAARHFSSPSDNIVQQISSTYGLDQNEVKTTLQGTADFGNYHAENGVVGESNQIPEDYTEIDLSSVGSANPQDSSGNGVQSHEAVVPVNIAVKKVADDLGMDPNSVYSAVKDAYGGDLSDEYHVSVQGEYHYYLPRSVMEKATNHPQPNPPQQQPQQGAPQQMPQQGGPGVNIPQPDTGQMQYASHYKLNNEQLVVLLTRDGKLADQRKILAIKE